MNKSVTQPAVERVLQNFSTLPTAFEVKDDILPRFFRIIGTIQRQID